MTPMDLLQDAVVTLVAVGAVAMLFRRMAGAVKPSSTPGCVNCPSAAGACHVPDQAAGGPGARVEQPLVFIRPPQR